MSKGPARPRLRAAPLTEQAHVRTSQLHERAKSESSPGIGTGTKPPAVQGSEEANAGRRPGAAARRPAAGAPRLSLVRGPAGRIRAATEAVLGFYPAAAWSAYPHNGLGGAYGVGVDAEAEGERWSP